jgi:bifunctional non-homologous end joining protein LigD
VFKSWPQLAEEIAHTVRATDCVVDGEICCLEPDGRSHFYKLLFRREWPHFCVFDLLALDGKDLRGLPLVERKRRLRRILPAVESRLLYLDHIAERGCDLFRSACERDLEGIVAKWARGTYQTDGRRTSWLKIRIRVLADSRAARFFRERRPNGSVSSCGRSQVGVEGVGRLEQWQRPQVASIDRQNVEGVEVR